MRARLIWVAATMLTTACQDGPNQIFAPNTGNPPQQNGYGTQTPYTPAGSKGYDEQSTGDVTGRARYCNEAEMTALVQQMVVAPIIPNQTAASIPLWDTTTGAPLSADKLFGRPENGGFCDPYELSTVSWGIEDDLLIWGPMDEILVWFNRDTRLVDQIEPYSDYSGTLEGNYTDPTTSEVRHVVIKNRDYVWMDQGAATDRKLNVYSSRAEQASKPNSWLNYDNITRMYRMVRETFFATPPSTWAADFDCVADHLCDIIYDSSNETVPQRTQINFVDSGTVLVFYPSGNVDFIVIEPVRVATFETSGTVNFDATAVPGEMHYQFTSSASDPALSGCQFSLDEDLTFDAFQSRCIESQTMLARANYNTHTQRDAVDVEFNGMTLSFYHPTSSAPLFKDGERPTATDTLYEITFSRDLMAPVAEFVPADLAADYALALQGLLHDAVDPVLSPCTGGVGDNIFCQYAPLDTANIPVLPAVPHRIGELMYKVGSESKSWLPVLFSQITADYYALSFADRAHVDPRILDPVVLIEPFLKVVMSKLTHSASAGANAITRFMAQDNHEFVIADTSFVQNGTPYRVELQYTLFYGALTTVIVSRGNSEIDQIFDNLVKDMDRVMAGYDKLYYEESMAAFPGLAPTYVNPYALNAAGVRIASSQPYDRQLSMLSVILATRNPTTGATGSLSLKTPGDWMTDNAGYYRQTAGERFEWVPANVVRLYGRETSLVLSVEADGKIGRATQSMFKGAVELCDGLAVKYGDDVRAQATAWEATHNPDEINNCNLVFNYSTNGNVLDSVAGLNKRVSVSVMDNRAVSASIWR